MALKLSSNILLAARLHENTVSSVDHMKDLQPDRSAEKCDVIHLHSGNNWLGNNMEIFVFSWTTMLVCQNYLFCKMCSFILLTWKMGPFGTREYTEKD